MATNVIDLMNQPKDKLGASYKIATLSYWLAFALDVMVALWFGRNFNPWIRIILGILVVFMPVGWSVNRAEYKAIRAIDAKMENRSEGFDQVMAVAVTGLTRQ